MRRQILSQGRDGEDVKVVSSLSLSWTKAHTAPRTTILLNHAEHDTAGHFAGIFLSKNGKRPHLPTHRLPVMSE
jgi:hypothetical protein